MAGDRVALRGRLRVDLPTEVARTTIIPALPAFMATHPELELEVSSTDRQVDLVQEGFDCVLRLGPIRDENFDCPPTRPVANGQRCQSRLPRAPWRPSIAGRSPATGTSDNSFFDHVGLKTLWMGISGCRQLRDASSAWCATCQQRADLRSCRPRWPWPDLGALLGIGRYLESGALVEIMPEFRRRPLAVSLVVAHRSNLSRRVPAHS